MDIASLFGRRRRLVLLADDDSVSRTLLRLQLQEAGYEVEEAADGAGAARCAHRRPPCLILMDVTMPVMDGLDATAAIRRDARTKDVPIIVCTSRDRLRDIESALAAGATDFIEKPVDFPRLAVKMLKAIAVGNA